MLLHQLNFSGDRTQEIRIIKAVHDIFSSYRCIRPFLRPFLYYFFKRVVCLNLNSFLLVQNHVTPKNAATFKSDTHCYFLMH